MNRYVGAGLTAFGLVGNRLNDSIGMGVALSWLNQNIFERKTELMLQAYYQAQIINGVYLEPALSYIPAPGCQPIFKACLGWDPACCCIILTCGGL